MLENLRKYINNKYGIDIIENTTRKKDVVRLKSAAINVLYWYFNNTMTSIADELGYDCHTSILHHIKDHKDRYAYDNTYADMYDDLKEMAFKSRPDVVGGLDYILDVINQLENA